MAVLTKLADVYDALDAAVAAMSNGDDKDTVTRIAVKLKNRRGVLSELVNTKADPATFTYAADDVDHFDHL